MRQLGVGVAGGADAFAIFRQRLLLEWRRGELSPIARIKIDEKNFYGSWELPAIREAVQEHLPLHSAAVGWKTYRAVIN